MPEKRHHGQSPAVPQAKPAEPPPRARPEPQAREEQRDRRPQRGMAN
jgi:hypothetical protein